jgi:hypothetical protein
MKLCTGEAVRLTARRAYCLDCHRPVEYHTWDWHDKNDRTNKTDRIPKRHYPNGTVPGSRLGIPNR